MHAMPIYILARRAWVEDVTIVLHVSLCAESFPGRRQQYNHRHHSLVHRPLMPCLTSASRHFPDQLISAPLSFSQS